MLLSKIVAAIEDRSCYRRSWTCVCMPVHSQNVY